MVRVRRNAKRMRDESFPRAQNEGETIPQEETGGNAKQNERAPPPPPPPQEETGRETSSQREQIEGETNAPPPQEETGGETSSQRGQNEGEMNPQEETGGNAKQKERAPPLPEEETGGNVKRKESAPPPQEETGGENFSQRGQKEGEMNPSQEGTGGEDSSSTCSEEVIYNCNEITVTVDPDSLNCPICFDPLRRPIYQCILGHIVCVSCWEKGQYECPTCNKPKGPQNSALEKMLDAIYLRCPNANYGCPTSISYSQMDVHTETCEYGPSPGGSESSDSMAAKTKRRKTLNPPSHQEENGGGEEETTGRNEIRATIDPTSLECGICSDPLCPPLYQCINDHIACYSCYKKVQYKCPMCNKPIGTQNIALEKMLESIHLTCPHASFGCCQSLSYSEMQLHTKTCEFGQSLCPIQGCNHKAFSGEWRGHFLKDHRDRSIYYSYGHSLTIILNEEDLYYGFIGPGKDLFLLVKEPIPNFGNVISLFYIDLPDLGENYFSYELEEWWLTGRSYKSPAVSIKEWKRGELQLSSLFVPSRVSSGYKVHVLINKKE